jgi:hypothetical protein
MRVETRILRLVAFAMDRRDVDWNAFDHKAEEDAQKRCLLFICNRVDSLFPKTWA